MIKVYGDLVSGNCFKVKLILDLTRTPHQWIHTSVMAGDTRTPEFLAMNPNGRVPLVELEPGDYLAESNAALYFFADGSPLWPEDRRSQAEVLKWMFFEQYSHEPYIATSIFKVHFLKQAEELADELDAARPKGYAALGIMEQALARTTFLAGGHATIADIALYAYTHRAHLGGFSLEGYASIKRWICEVEALPGFVAMPKD
jgi:glutathione S-transferase